MNSSREYPPRRRSRRSLAGFALIALLSLAAIVTAAKFIALRGWRSDRSLIALFREGVSSLERHEYLEAYKKFREVSEYRPAWPAAHSNAGLAAFNYRRDRASDYLPIAEKEFQEALRLDPSNRHARFALGRLYNYQERYDEALEEFQEVARADPNDPYVLYEYGALLADRGDLGRARFVLEEALGLQPAFGSAAYKLGQVVYRNLGLEEKKIATLKRFAALRDSRESIISGIRYGEAGKYSFAIQDPFPREEAVVSPVASSMTVSRAPFPPQTVGAPAARLLRPDGSAAPPAFAMGDLDGDGILDLVLCGQPASSGPRTQVLKGEPSGHSFRKLSDLDADGAAAALGDLDGDGDLDLVLAGEDSLAVLENDGRGGFSPAKLKVPPAGPGFPLRVLVFDSDADWDLDILAVRQVKEGDRIETALELLNNKRDDSFEDIAGKIGIASLPLAATGALFLDADGDIDLDIVVLGKGPEGSLVLVNDRAWRYRRVGLEDMGGLKSILARAGLPRPVEEGLLDARPDPGVSLAVTADASGIPLIFRARSGEALEVVPAGPAPWSWIGFDLEGVKEPQPGLSWANLSGIGSTLEIRPGALRGPRQVLGTGVGGASGPCRTFFDLGIAGKIDYLRVIWPDGLLQSEPNLVANEVHRIIERSRRRSSCPIVFAWTEDRFEYVGDCLGVGGLGYLVAPGEYSKPDPTEVLELPPLKPLDGDGGSKEYRLSIIEHLEECTYLDALELVAADAPAGVTIHPDELFAVKAPAPGATLLSYRKGLVPARALAGKGRDLGGELHEIDRIYDDGWSADPRFPGAAEPHSIILEWDEDLPCGPTEPGPADPRPMLLAYGYVEYGYSTSNFAAAQAGVSLHAPTVSVERGGKWVPLREEWGFPGGTPRWMAVDLGGLLRPGDRRLRVDTDMEVYFDQVFLAEAAPVSLGEIGRRSGRLNETPGAGGKINVTAIAPSRAALRFRGFPRAVEPPDGSYPMIHDYDDVSRDGEMKPFPGRYTRHGEVVDMVLNADDRLAILGEGDEVLVSFPADRLPPVPQGWHRTFFLAAVGYCKDMDLYTAASDRIEPLPFRAMTAYPPAPGERPEPGAASAAARNDRVVEPHLLR